MWLQRKYLLFWRQLKHEYQKQMQFTDGVTILMKINFEKLMFSCFFIHFYICTTIITNYLLRSIYLAKENLKQAHSIC